MPYIDTPENWCHGRYYPGFSWAEHTERRLAQQYGPERAKAKMAGRDAEANADLDAWNGLGRRRAAA